MSRKTGILIHFDGEFIALLDQLSKALGTSRAELIRRSLARDVKFIRDVELPKWRSNHQELSEPYRNFINENQFFIP